uniref:Sushi domain-containing protein n=1 Tax=Oreochromis niloticus TaxID=8128 RepID=A0A669B1Z8_ORENI
TQDCSRPVGDNMDLKGNDILLTSFPDGTTVTFACNIGYESAGGSPRITCTAGSWSSLGLKCQTKGGWAGCLYVKVGCLVLIQVTPLIKSSLLVFILTNFYFYFPMIQCESPPVVEYGSFSPNKDIYEYNEVTQYTCKKDYTLVGSRQLICLEDGTFKPEPPRCISKCFESFSITCSLFPDGTTVTFACNTGYESAGGSPRITCTAGSWSSLGRTHLWKPRVDGQVACM